MFERLLEIAFEAELDTKEHPEMLDLEHQATRAAAITVLRKKILEFKECVPYRVDDDFLLRFLRAKDFQVQRAYKLLIRYCKFKEDYKHLYEGVDLWSVVKFKNVCECNIIDRFDIGRLFILRFGKWDPNDFSIEDVLRIPIVGVEICLRQPRLQLLGSTAVIDLEGITFRQITSITPSIAHQVVCLFGLAMPGRCRAVHVINNSWILNCVFYLFKRWIHPQLWNSIHFHGNDLKSLHRHIDMECLPPRLGGTSRSIVSAQNWLNHIMKYRTEEFNRDMKQLG